MSENRQDFYYPSVLDPWKRLQPEATADAIRKIYDLFYKLNPPDQSGSSLLDNEGFIHNFTVKLDTGQVFLHEQQFSATTGNVTWNQHFLDWKGTTYTISAGSSTNKWVYWQLSNSSKYSSASSFPNLGENDFLIGVYRAATGEFFEFWQAKASSFEFISTALIEDASITTAKIQDLAVSTAKIANLAVTTAKIDNLAVTNAKVNDLSADKITTGTLAATVTITADNGCDIILNRSDTNPAELIWQSTSTIFAEVGSAIQYWNPLTTATSTLQFGTVTGPKYWNAINGWTSNGYSFAIINGTDDVRYIMGRSTAQKHSFVVNNSNDRVFIEYTGAALAFRPSTNNTWELGTSGNRWSTIWGTALNISGTLTASAFSGDGSALTSLNASNISSGTLNTARLPTDVVKYGGSAITGNITVSDGYGITNGDEAWAFSSTDGLVGYSNTSTEIMRINTTTTKMYIDGTYYTLTVVGGVVTAT